MSHVLFRQACEERLSLALERAEKAEADRDRYREALKRKYVLDNYGITFENIKTFGEWLEIVSSNDRIEKWFGQSLEDYVLREFAAVGGDDSPFPDDPSAVAEIDSPAAVGGDPE